MPDAETSTGSQADLRLTLSGSIAQTLIHHEEADPEQQPLRTQNSPVANRERFQQNQRQAAQGVVQRSQTVLLVVVVLVSVLAIVWVMFYFRGWSVWKDHKSKPCDQPLANWLLGMLILPLMALVVECCSCKKLRILLIFITLIVLLIGIRSFHYSKTCDETNPELYIFVRQYLIFLSIWWVTCVVTPLVFVAVVIYGMWHGWFDELNGASPDTIKQVTTVPWDAALFAVDGKSDDGKPAPECCICTETFDAEREIKRTTCQHHFHEECLGKWLRVSTTCPLCRNDLEKRVDGSPSSPWPGGQSWVGTDPMDLPETATSEWEAQEVQSLCRALPSLDETTALLAVRQSGSAEAAAAILGEP